MTNSITATVVKIEGQGWTKVSYDMKRDGVIIGTAFKADDGKSFTLEFNDGAYAFTTMKALKGFLARSKKTFEEKLSEAGIKPVPSNSSVTEDEKTRKNILEAVEAHRFDNYSYFGGQKPKWSTDSIRAEMNVKQFAKGTESWADFLFATGIQVTVFEEA